MKRAPNSADKHVGNLLRQRRLSLHMSQSALGNALGVTFQQIQKYENGRNRVGASRLHLLAQVLKVDVGFFFINEGAQAASSSAADEVTAFLLTREGLALMNAFQKVPKNKLRRKILALVQQLADEREHELIQQSTHIEAF